MKRTYYDIQPTGGSPSGTVASLTEAVQAGCRTITQAHASGAECSSKEVWGERDGTDGQDGHAERVSAGRRASYA